MNYNVFQNRHTAVLFRGPLEDLPSELSAWKHTDLDAFSENLAIWCPEGLGRVAALFTNPIPGLRQHLANQRDINVALVGNILAEDAFREDIKAEYLKRGYDVLVVDGVSVEFTEAEQDDKVRICWH